MEDMDDIEIIIYCGFICIQEYLNCAVLLFQDCFLGL